jgi:hypothetical protein
MLPAPSYSDILRRAPAWGTPEDPLGQRLVSVVFAHPGSYVWAELATNRAFLDARSGDQWDLFFAGMSGFAPMPHEVSPSRLSGPHSQYGLRLFNPRSFTKVANRISREHLASLAESDKRMAWEYSGGTDLVSFMCYAKEPDWLTLKSVRLYPWSRLRPGASLSEVTEGLRQWQRGNVNPLLAPGEAPGQDSYPFDCLTDALYWSATTIVAGVLGNAVYDLLENLLK